MSSRHIQYLRSCFLSTLRGSSSAAVSQTDSRQVYIMALAYPEGECFFKRSALNAQQQDGYHADNCKDFYSHIMVEYIWNQEAYHGSTDAKTYTGKRSHPRSEYRVVNGDWWNTDYGVWCNVPFSYGPTPNDIKRRFEHNLCTWGNRIRDREKGASAEVSSSFLVLVLQSLTLRGPGI